MKSTYFIFTAYLIFSYQNYYVAANVTESSKEEEIGENQIELERRCFLGWSFACDVLSFPKKLLDKLYGTLFSVDAGVTVLGLRLGGKIDLTATENVPAASNLHYYGNGVYRGGVFPPGYQPNYPVMVEPYAKQQKER